MMKDVYLPQSYSLPETGVKFCSEDKELQCIFDECERLCKNNIKEFGDYTCLIEGAKYNGVWLETQPMGGEMYAKRNLTVALNNILIFMRYQRRDGRYAGMITDEGVWRGITAHYDWMQGCFLPHAALKLYYHIGQDKDYLLLLYESLKDFDNYLWQYRDSDGNGCLESWCVWDTGEDNCTKTILAGSKMPEAGAWGKSVPPQTYGGFPYESAEYMSYSYACRAVLCEIAKLLENGEHSVWAQKAEQVRAKVYEYLWDNEKKACFDRDAENKVVAVLAASEHIKCMYSGMFSQEMADEFIGRHLLNKEEFWTPYPLPSIAANDSYFHVNAQCSNCAEQLYALVGQDTDFDDNSWSGPVQGLTYQRSIDALLNYNHHAETALVGGRFLDMLKQTKVFVQQYHPFTAEYCEKAQQGYGPTMLAALEYISILYGVNLRYDTVLWSGVRGCRDFTYVQTMTGSDYKLVCEDGTLFASINGKQIFRCNAGVRIKTDRNGTILSVYGLSETAVNITLVYKDKTFSATVLPNMELQPDEASGQMKTVRQIPFDYMGE